jgi:stringent starvation protein B
MMQAPETTSTRPYLIRALYEWCTDNGFTPYVAVLADESTQVPREHVKNGEIVLNISFDATSSLKLGNEFIEFKARFGGAARDIVVPVDRVLAIYARENGQGMAFPAPSRPPAPDANSKSGARPVSNAEVASTDAQPPRIVPLATVPGKDKSGDAEPPKPPKPPNAPGARPSLKRVK